MVQVLLLQYQSTNGSVYILYMLYWLLHDYCISLPLSNIGHSSSSIFCMPANAAQIWKNLVMVCK